MTQVKERGRRKTYKGVVISNKMDKTVVVQVERTLQHSSYKKVIKKKKKYYAHNDGDLNCGDQVVIVESRPLSKLKRWRVVEGK